MSLRIGTNVAALAARRNLNNASAQLTKNFGRLATGRRILSAADDAAGLSASARLTAQIGGLNQAVRNANEGIAMVEVGESTLGQVQDTLLRMRELAVQGSSATLAAADRANLASEFVALRSELTSIANAAVFNGNTLAGGTTAITLQVGASGATNITITPADSTASGLAVDSSVLTDTTTSAAAVTALDTAIGSVTSRRGAFGAVQSRLEVTINSLESRAESFSSANSRLIDVDIASETADLTKNQILQQSALAVLAQANAAPRAALQLLNF